MYFSVFRHLFSEDLKWHKNSEEIFKNIKSRFNAYSKFKSFNTSATQCNHFIQSLILPVLLYNSVLWFYSYTDGERTMLLSYFEGVNFDCDIPSVVCKRVLETAEKLSNDPEHSLNHCYKLGRRSFISPKSKTTRFTVLSSQIVLLHL